MFWTLDMPAFECITNPRCIRPEDYHPADDPSIRYDVDSIPQNELGKLPLWKIFALTYVSCCNISQLMRPVGCSNN